MEEGAASQTDPGLVGLGAQGGTGRGLGRCCRVPGWGWGRGCGWRGGVGSWAGSRERVGAGSGLGTHCPALLSPQGVVTAKCSWLFKPRLCSSFQCFSSFFFFFCRLRFLVKKWQQVDGRGALAPGQALHPGTSDPKCFRAGFLLRAKWEDPKPRERPVTQPVHLSGGSGIVKENGFYLGYRHRFV